MGWVSDPTLWLCSDKSSAGAVQIIANLKLIGVLLGGVAALPANDCH